MKCPHCEYIDGPEWDGDDCVETKGDKGHFRQVITGTIRERQVSYECPSCKKTFIDN